MPERPLRYQLFILGLWEEPAAQPGNDAGWRFTLEHPQTATRTGFKSLEDLSVYLRNWLQDQRGGDQQPPLHEPDSLT
ncbi:MAG: hypothetical protein J5I90_02485 [Caldilineales bacterium]|nr:hypothetical protein [Caldilineales bacterium]